MAGVKAQFIGRNLYWMEFGVVKYILKIVYHNKKSFATLNCVYKEVSRKKSFKA